MDVPNGYGRHVFGGGSNVFGGGSNSFGGGSNGFGGESNGFDGGFGGANNGNHRQTYYPLGYHQGATQTTNHGASIFNLYFVNSGQYDLRFNGPGLSQVATQAAGSSKEQPQQPFNHSTATNNPNNIGIFAPGIPFPNTSGTGSASNANFFTNNNGGHPARPAALQSCRVLPMSTVPPQTLYNSSAFRPVQPSTAVGGQQSFANANTFCNARVPNSYTGPHFSGYRDAHNFSQGVFEDDLYEEVNDQDQLCENQYSDKPAHYGGH